MIAVTEKSIGTTLFFGGTILALIGALMWNHMGHIAGLGMIISSTGIFIRTRSPEGSERKSMEHKTGIVLFILGFLTMGLRALGL